MTHARWHRIKKASSLIGAFLLCTTNAVPWYWGNIVVYTDSYFRDFNGSDDGLNSPWVISSFLIMWMLGVMLSDNITRLTGRRTVTIIAIIMFDSSMSITYLAVQHSMVTLTLSVGVICGFASGLTYGQIIAVVIMWVDQNVGTATAAVTTGFQAGSIIINQIATHYVNPDNLEPNVLSGAHKYFGQRQILDSVPDMFIVLGIFSMSLHIVGFLLIWNRQKDGEESSIPTEEQDNETQITDENIHDGSKMEREHLLGKETQKRRVDDGKNTTDFLARFNIDDDDVVKNQKLSEKVGGPVKVTLSSVEAGQSDRGVMLLDVAQPQQTMLEQPIEKQCDIVEQRPVSYRDKGKCSTPCDFTLMDMIKTRTFWVLLFAIGSIDMAYIVMTNFYKKFGQTSIPDDHFLTNISLCMALGVVLVKIFWGVLIDKVGLKTTIICTTSSLAILLNFWFFTPLISRYFFAGWTTLFGCVACCLHVIESVGVMKAFGKTNFSRKFSLTMMGSIVVNLVAPLLIEWVLYNFGWCVLFISVGSLLAVTLILVVILFQNI